MFGLGTQELMIILLIALLLFGAQKLPELARGLGKSVKEFKRATEEEPGERGRSAAATPSAPAAAPASRCAGCQSPLQPDWKHCPRCGAAVTPAAPTAGG